MRVRDIIIYSILVSTIVVRGYFVSENPDKYRLLQDVGEEVTYEGMVSAEPLTKDFIKTFTFKTDEGIAIRVGSDKFSEFEFGDRARITGKLSQPFNFSGKGGRVFNYIDYLGKDGIFYEFKKADVIILEKAEARSLRVQLFRLKRKFIENLQKVLGEPHASLASGLVVGEKASLGKEILDDFRRAGLIHIIVLSGYNITIIATSIRKVLSFLPRNTSIIVGGLGIILFGILVGGGATVVRSCIMALIALFGELFRREYNVVRALLLAAAVMLIENPLILLYDPSFQLSFLATLGLVLLSPRLEEKLTFITEKAGFRSLVATTFATQIFVSPLIFYMMGEISLIGIVVNLIVLPLVPITMLVVFITGFFGFFSHLISQFFGWCSHILLSYELFMVEKFAELPFATIEVPKFSGWIMTASYVFYLAAFLKLPSIVSQFIFAKKSSM